MLKKTIFIIIIILAIFMNLTYADDKLSDESLTSIELEKAVETSSNITELPKINSRHAIVLDRASQTILYGKKEQEKCKMASTTKIMTAIVVIENAKLSDTVIISSKAAGTGGSRLKLSTNDKITVENLLYGLMLRSGNDAAVALAEHVGGSIEGFAELMNSKAQELGLTSTHFVTPHGLDNDGHYTTAYELAILTDYALKNKTFSKIVNTKTCTITQNGYSKTLSNTNELLGNLNGVYGVKTGFTNGANRCLVTSCKRGDLDIICVVLGCDTKKDRTRDSINLINYIFSNFSVVNIEDIINSDFSKWYKEHSNSFTVNKGISQNLKLILDKTTIPYSSIAVNKSN
ncbi:MAG: D-alanyl-D-alanine carboxypeptidase, partial [Clostridia bacterium]|nr:D-alanyl-D-alanine carboxypeptidase [Clostridia bacterium]